MSDNYLTVYALHRDEDVTGVSGDGIVGYVVDWPHPNDRVTLAWTTTPNVIETACSVDELMEIHGHGSATQLIQQYKMDTGGP